MPLFDHLDKLHAFKIIVEAGKLREAAQRLNVTQPSLTRLIQTLENCSQHQLLLRNRSGMTPTDAGKLLYNFSVVLMKELENLETHMKSPNQEMAGFLRIGSYESLTEYLWPDFILFLKTKYPGIKLTVTTTNSMNHHHALRQQHLDLVVDVEPHVADDLTSWPLYGDRFNFYARPAVFGKKLNPKSSQNIPLIYCPHATDRDKKSILQNLESKGYEFSEKIELDSFPSIATFAAKGLGIAVLPQKLASAKVRSKQLEPVSLEQFSNSGFGDHRICATIKSERAQNKRIQKIIKLLRDWFKREDDRS